MTGPVYKKDLLQSFSKSKGRFFSIFSLMMIGSLALVGLKVTTPNMQRTAQAYIDRTQLFDLAVMGDYGLSDQDVAELKTIKGAMVEFGYLTDVTVAGTNQAVRIFSVPESISKPQIISGKLPTESHEIALADKLQDTYQLGDRIQFATKEDSPLSQQTFTVTGFVTSAEIWDREAMGQTTVGTGDLQAYAVVAPSAFDSSVYMIARLAYDDLAGVHFYDEAYDGKIAEHQSQLESLLADNGHQRLSVLKADAQKDIDQGYADMASSEKTLAEAGQRITAGEEELATGQAHLVQARQQLASGQADLDKSASDLDSGQARLTQFAQELAQAKAVLDISKLELDQTSQELAAAQAQLAIGQSQLTASQAQLTTADQELNLAQAQLADSKAQLEQLATVIQAAQAHLAQREQELQALEAQYQAGLAAHQAGQAQYDKNLASYQAGLAEYEAGQAEYDRNKAQYDTGLVQYQQGLAQYEAGLAQYQAGVAEYESGLATYQSGLAAYQAGQEQLYQASSAIAQNQAAIDEAQAKLTASKADYERQKAEAETKMSAARADLSAAQKDLDELEVPTYQVHTRQSLLGSNGYDTFNYKAEAIASVGNIFPIVLYLVAAMVTLTTMTRFVDEERTNAGIFKALGYTNPQIIRKFVTYGLLASLAGTAVGVVLGHTLLSSLIGDILTQSTVLGSITHYIYPVWILVAVVLALLSAVLPAYLVARRHLAHEHPAQLLQAKPPVAGASILLERQPFIWNKMSFTQKVTARNIFRYKQRMLMTIFGVAGSVALLFAGLGIQSSISGVADTQFEDIIGYELIVAENGRAEQADLDSLETALASSAVADSLALGYRSLTEKVSGKDSDQTISLLIADGQALAELIQLRERGSGQALVLSDQGVIITEKLAELYQVAVGDTFSLTLEDQEVSLEVSGITELYAGHYLYMTPAYYQELTQQPAIENAYLVDLKDSRPEQVQEVAADFLALDGVAGVVQNTSLKATLTQTASSLEAIMLVLIALSILLAVVILYNLTNINVAERIRELSTIKVLGFHNKEVTLYIYRETMVLSVIGIVTGLAGGFALHRLLLSMIASSDIMFQPQVAGSVYLIPILVITGILAVLGWFVNHKLRQVDMLEALKSVD